MNKEDFLPHTAQFQHRKYLLHKKPTIPLYYVSKRHKLISCMCIYVAILYSISSSLILASGFSVIGKTFGRRHSQWPRGFDVVNVNWYEWQGKLFYKKESKYGIWALIERTFQKNTHIRTAMVMAWSLIREHPCTCHVVIWSWYNLIKVPGSIVVKRRICTWVH